MSVLSSTCDDASARHAWAEHLIWMEGGALPAEGPRRRWPGLLLAFGLAAAAFVPAAALPRANGGAAGLLDPILLSMLLGLAAGGIAGRGALVPGIDAAVRLLLPWGIVLLGARMDFFDALAAGAPALMLSAGVVVFSLALVFGLRRRLGLGRRFAALLGVGTGICGGTAIVAVAPLVRAREREVVLGVALVTLAGLAAMLALPALGTWLGLSQSQFGLLAGLTIHQTPQVIAAGFSYGEEAGQTATVVKLARVCLLAPVAVAVAWWFSRSGAATAGTARRAWSRAVPGFAIGFLALAGVHSLGWLPEIALTWGGGGGASTRFGTAEALRHLSAFLLAAAMVGVGFQTRGNPFREIGLRPLAAAATASLIVALAVLTVVCLWFE